MILLHPIPFPDVTPGALRGQLRGLVRLLSPDERADRWAWRRCAALNPARADRMFFAKYETLTARAYCGRCPARVQCALRALEEDARSDYPPEGVFGGLTATERAQALADERPARVG